MKRPKAKAEEGPALALGDTVALRETDAQVYRKVSLYSDLGREEPMTLVHREDRGGEKIWYCKRANGGMVLARPRQLMRLTAKGRKGART